MGKKFNGNIKLASSINRTGAQPLDDSVVVASVSDLYNSFGATAYEGMMVCVLETQAIYILISLANVANANGWKKIGDVSSELTNLQTQITTVKGTADKNKAAIDKLNGTTDATSVSKKITDAINKLDVSSNVSDDSYGVNVTVNQVNGKVQKPSISVSPVETAAGVTSDSTAANKLITAKAVRLAIDEKVAAEVSGVRKFVGCVSALSELPTNPRVGDVYNVTNEFTLLEKKYPAGTDVAWVGVHTDGSTTHKAHWEPLGGVIDYSSLKDTQSGIGNIVKTVTQTDGKITVTKGNAAIGDVTGLQSALDTKVAKTTKVNNKALSGNIELYGKDIKITEDAQLPAVGTGALAVNDTIDVAVSKLKRDIDKVNSKEVVTHFGSQSGDITVDGTGTGNYKVKLAMSGKRLGATISGLGTAAAKNTEDFVRMTPDNTDNVYNEGALIIGEDIGNYTKVENNGITITKTPVDGGASKEISIINNGSELDLGGAEISNVGTPTKDHSVTTKEYVDGQISPVANKANTAVQSASILKASQAYLAVEKDGTKLIFNTKVASVGGNTDGLATASGVKTYVDACVGNALTWTTFE